MDPEAGNVIISYLYFPAGKSRVLVEVHFVIGTILSGGNRNASMKEEDQGIQEEAIRSTAAVKRTTLRGLRDRRE